MDAQLRVALVSIYARTKTIATVGASASPGKPAHEIPRYLRSQGYRIIPITPRRASVFDEPTRGSLEDLGERPDVVNVFRPPEEAEAVARATIAVGAPVLWFQPGTESTEAIEVARAAGVALVFGRCMGVTHAELGLGLGPWR